MNRDERTKQYLARRARPLEEKTVSVVIRKTKNYGLGKGYGNRNVTLIAGKCPCSVCGHEWMWECEDADCKCCTSVCN